MMLRRSKATLPNRSCFVLSTYNTVTKLIIEEFIKCIVANVATLDIGRTLWLGRALNFSLALVWPSYFPLLFSLMSRKNSLVGIDQWEQTGTDSGCSLVMQYWSRIYGTYLFTYLSVYDNHSVTVATHSHDCGWQWAAQGMLWRVATVYCKLVAA